MQMGVLISVFSILRLQATVERDALCYFFLATFSCVHIQRLSAPQSHSIPSPPPSIHLPRPIHHSPLLESTLNPHMSTYLLKKKQHQPQRSYTRTSCAHVRLDPTGRTSERTGRSTRPRHRRCLLRRIPGPGPARTRTRSGSSSGGDGTVGNRIWCVGEICESCGSATDRRGWGCGVEGTSGAGARSVAVVVAVVCGVAAAT